MVNHPAVLAVVERIETDAIGGAADTALEVISAFATMVADSASRTADELAEEVMQATVAVLRVMPAIAPPVNALHRFIGRMEEELAAGSSANDLKATLKGTAADFRAWTEEALGRVASYGAEKVVDGGTVFMYSMSSTVWGILRLAKQQGKVFDVVVTESRPGNEGLWTVSEMEKQGIPVSVSIDACVGELVPRCNIVFVGADAISSDGTCLCKAGTYPTALTARAHGVPFYVAADTLKLDSSTLLGLPFRVDPLKRQDVLGEGFGTKVKVVGVLFDETPPDLITAVITELGIISPMAVAALLWQAKLSHRLNEIIPSWSRGTL